MKVGLSAIKDFIRSPYDNWGEWIRIHETGGILYSFPTYSLKPKSIYTKLGDQCRH